MKRYNELDLEEKEKLALSIQDVIFFLPVDNTFFISEKKDFQGNSFLKTKQDYDKDKNEILRIIEIKRKEGLIDKEKAKQMKCAITILFNEFIRISPKKTYEIDKKEDIMCNDALKAVYNGEIMDVGELYVKISETYVKLPEKVLYKIMNIPGNDKMQSMQYTIREEQEVEYLSKNRGENYGRK